MRRVGVVAAAIALAGVFMAPAAQAAPPVTLFGTAEFKARSLTALPQWQKVLAAIESERDDYRRCAADASACANRGVMAWQALLKGLEGAPPREQIAKVNRFVNQWRYRTDDSNYGRSDYWASPLEFMSHAGDCEDYAITKYVSLRQLGFPAENLRMVVLQDTLRDLAHAVLAVYVDGTALILDNNSDAVLPHDRIAQYVPYYSVNETTRWTHVPASRLMLSADMTGEGTSTPAARSE